jgi:uncharacterized protein DUF3558
MRLAPSNLGVALLVLLLISACSGAEPSNAPTAPAATSTRFGAPTVPRNLNLAVVADSPCRSLLSSDDLRALGATGTSKEDEYLGAKGCTWSVGPLQRFSISVYNDRDLLADTYRAHLDPVFVPTEVEGFPAVRQKTGRGELNICTVTTGVANRGALDALWLAPGTPAPGNDACEFAEQATALVIRKLPPQR